MLFTYCYFSSAHLPPSSLLVIRAIFASEKIEDVIPLAANAILILGQGNM